MIFAIVVLCLFYFVLYSRSRETVPDDSNFDKWMTRHRKRRKMPFRYSIQKENKDEIKITVSGQGVWTFRMDSTYVFDEKRGEIREKDPCFNVADGTKLKAGGLKLYEMLLHKKQTAEGAFYQYYFACQNGRIDDLYSCPLGETFVDGHCQPSNICTGKNDGDVFPNPINRALYVECLNETPVQKQCASDTFFIVDRCRETQITCETIRRQRKRKAEEEEQDDILYPLSPHKYIRCQPGSSSSSSRTSSVVETCPQGTSILMSWDRCYPDGCIGVQDGDKIPMPKISTESFEYSPGYSVCQNNKIDKNIECHKLWDWYHSNLHTLPTVFNGSKCVPPSFCENVQPVNADVIVPVHEFTKHASSWKFSSLFDSVSGYRCQGNNRTRVHLEPGKWIRDYRIVPATSGSKIPVAGESDRYYDCDRQEIVPCPERHVFDGRGCTPPVENAHTYKNIPLVKMNNLSPYNDWMQPWEVIFGSPPTIQCKEPETEYIFNFHVCSHPDCAKYPFLRQLGPDYPIFLPDSKHVCVFSGGKIRKKKYDSGRYHRINFWNQRVVPRFLYDPGSGSNIDECVPGQRVRSGNFLFQESVLFATCNPQQPFVFCPSVRTKGIERVGSVFACIPEESVFEAEIPADSPVKLYVREISYILPESGAYFRVDDGEPILFGQGQHAIPMSPILGMDDTATFTLWSDRAIRVFYQRLVGYPVQVFFNSDGRPEESPGGGGYWLRRDKSVNRPLSIPYHSNILLE